MRVVEIIRAKVWEHKETGRHVSIYGASPGPKDQWELIEIGWTWRLSNGTVGLGIQPVKTRKEAVAKKREINAKHRQRIKAAKDFYKPLK